MLKFLTMQKYMRIKLKRLISIDSQYQRADLGQNHKRNTP